ncbi:MAG: hypothetical protein LT106_13020 [Burkholderiaceae bacterium]|nr:hypothetical protein [Burkholderiaceae bacterium]
MQTTLLFTVADAFQIKGRGCVLAPGPSAEPGTTPIHIGDAIRLIFPDGGSVDTQIRGLEMINFRKRPEVITVPILLPSDLKKDDVPPGTQVYLLRRAGHDA